MSKKLEELPIKIVKAPIKLWKLVPYKDSKIYIRQIYEQCFEYLVMWRDNIYTDNIIITPEPGKTKLTNPQQHTCFAWIFAAATTTVDELRGEGASQQQKDQAQAVIDVMTADQKVKNNTKILNA